MDVEAVVLVGDAEWYLVVAENAALCSLVAGRAAGSEESCLQGVVASVIVDWIRVVLDCLANGG